MWTLRTSRISQSPHESSRRGHGRKSGRRVKSGLLLLAVAGSTALSTNLAGASTRALRQTDQVVSTRHVAGVGTVLVDSAGKTLYSPNLEAKGHIHCTGSCLVFWFPLTASSHAAPSAPNIPKKALSTIRRPDTHQLQVTYLGRPLYTFRLDGAPGQATGNDYTDHFNGMSFTWHAIVVGKPQASTPTTQPAAGTSSGGYSTNY
jgi:predicted lipoprotein with Yx(FWY)xxD motif